MPYTTEGADDEGSPIYGVKLSRKVYSGTKDPEIAEWLKTAPVLGAHKPIHIQRREHDAFIDEAKPPIGEIEHLGLRGSTAIQEVVDDGKDGECRVAHQADLLCRIHPRPDDQSRPGALHGQANGCEDDRDRGEPPSADLTSRCDHEPDLGGTCRLRAC